MVSAWFYDTSSPADPRQPHQFSRNKPVSLAQLADIGVIYYCIPINDTKKVEEIRKERKYKNMDTISVSKETYK